MAARGRLDQLVDHGSSHDRKPCREADAVGTERSGERGGDLLEREALSGPEDDQSGVENVGEAGTLADPDDRHAGASSVAEPLFVRGADPDHGGCPGEGALLDHRPDIASRTELLRKQGDEFARTRDHERPAVSTLGACLAGDAEQ